MIRVVLVQTGVHFRPIIKGGDLGDWTAMACFREAWPGWESLGFPTSELSHACASEFVRRGCGRYSMAGAP